MMASLTTQNTARINSSDDFESSDEWLITAKNLSIARKNEVFGQCNGIVCPAECTFFYNGGCAVFRISGDGGSGVDVVFTALFAIKVDGLELGSGLFWHD